MASAPKTTHVKLVKRVMGYLKGTAHKGLKWSIAPKPQIPPPDEAEEEVVRKEREAINHWNSWEPDQLVVYTDASWAQEHNARSATGVMAHLNGGPVSWIATQQEFATLSSSEAEIVAAATALREALHLRNLLEGMGKKQKTVVIHCDNQNAIRFSESERVTKRNHHIGARYFRLKDERKAGTVDIQFVRTYAQFADLQTKNTETEQFRRLVDTVMHDWRATHEKG